MNELLTLIGNVGFPIAVSVYLLIRVESKLSDLTGADWRTARSHHHPAADQLPGQQPAHPVRRGDAITRGLTPSYLVFSI
jgi:hypothetical protein